MTKSRSEGGDTLVEVLIALLVLGITATALLGGFATSISASSEHRGLATIDTVLNSFVENATDQIQLSSSPLFQPCQIATAAYYENQLSATQDKPQGYQPPTNYTATVASTPVEYWTGTMFSSSPDACVPNSVAPQLITATVNGPGNQTASLPFVVSDPDNAHPAFTSVNNDTVPAGSAASFAVTAIGGPLPALTAKLITDRSASCNTYTAATATTPLPLPGQGTLATDYLTFADNSDGTGTLGISASTPHSGGTPYTPYYMIFTANNNVGSPATQCFTLVVGAPTVSSIIPNGGPTAGGTLVTITGTGFVNNPDTMVYFGSNPGANVTYISPTQLTADSPGGAATVDVTVRTDAGTSATSSADQFTYNSSSQLAITTQPPSTTTAGVPFAVQVSVEDASGNLVPTSTAQVTLSIVANQYSDTLNCTGSTTQSAVAGVASFTCSIDVVGPGYTLIASSGGLTSTPASNPIAVTPGIGVQLAVSSFSATAGTTAITPVTVSMEDAYGNATTSNSSITVHLSSSSAHGIFASYSTSTSSCGTSSVTSVTLPANTSLVTACYGDTVAGSPTITASATGLTSGTQSETITGGTGTKLVITSAAISTTAGSSATNAFIVTLEDTFGNATTASSALTVNLSSSSSGAAFVANSGGSPVTTVSLPASTPSVTAYYADTVAGSPTITAAASSLTSGTQVETISAGPGAALVITSTPISTTAGTSATNGFTTTLEDSFGNVTTSSSQLTLGLSSSSTGAKFSTNSGGGSTATVTLPANTHAVTAYYADTVAGNPTITVANGALLSGMQAETVTAGSVAAAQSTVTATPTTVTANGTAISTVIVTLGDSFGNPVSGKTVTLTPSGGSSTISAASGSSNASGVVTFTVKDTKTEAITYTAKDTTDSPNVSVTQTATVTFTPGPVTAAQSTVTATPTSVTANGSATSTVTVTLEDANNNPVSGKTVTLAQSAGGHSSISAASGTSNASGVVTFTVKDNKTEALTYTATDTSDSVTVTQTATVTFTPGPVTAAQSTATATPTSVTANGSATSTVTVTLEDANNNPVSGKTVSLSQSNGGHSTISAASGTSNSNGVVTFTVTDTVTESVTYTAKDTSDNVTVNQTATVTFTPGPVSASASTVIATLTSAVTSTTVTVTLKDANNNPVSGKTVTLAQSTGGNSNIVPASGTSNALGQVTFTVTDTTIQSVTYTATDSTDGLTITQTATVHFSA